MIAVLLAVVPLVLIPCCHLTVTTKKLEKSLQDAILSLAYGESMFVLLMLHCLVPVFALLRRHDDGVWNFNAVLRKGKIQKISDE